MSATPSPIVVAGAALVGDGGICQGSLLFVTLRDPSICSGHPFVAILQLGLSASALPDVFPSDLGR